MPLASIWWRWLGPGAVLATGIAFFAASQLHEPSRVAVLSFCRLAALAPEGEMAFAAENDTAMSKMMTGMTVRLTGDADHDFVEMMVPHHQGAIDMAQALLRYSHNKALRRLAQEIIVTQQQEIAAMRLAVSEQLPPMVAAPDQISTK